MTMQQQKILLYCISKIKPNDPAETKYEIKIEDLCKACNIDIDGGGFYYKAIRDDMMHMIKRDMVEMPDGSQATVSWLGDFKFHKGSDTVDIWFNPNLSEYLFNLQQCYTQYKLEDIIVLKGKHSIRLYEILRSYVKQREIDRGLNKEIMLSIEKIRHMLSVDTYPRWADFNRFVLKKAVDEINLCSDKMHIEYDVYTGGGRNKTKVNFILSSPDVRQTMRAHEEMRKRGM
jgi:plasmid replication initiation protein